MKSDLDSVNTAGKLVPVDLMFEGEIVLNPPTQKVWPHLVNYTSWQNYSIARHVSGKPGQEGEVVLLKKEEGADFPPYYARTVKIDADRRIIWRTYPEKPRGAGDFGGVIDFRLIEAGGKTRFSYSLLYEFQLPGMSDTELVAFRAEQLKNVDIMFASILPKLKTLVESNI